MTLRFLWLGIFWSGVGFSLPALKLVSLIKKGLTDPTYVAVAPGEKERLYIVQQRGVISVLQKGNLDTEPFLDIVKKVESGGEMGLLSVAFHPSFEKNRRYFVP